MKRFHTALLLISTMLMMTTASFGQDNDKKTLILQLPDTHRWTTDYYDEADFWGMQYKGFIGDEKYPDIEIQQTNMFNQHIEVSPQQIAKQTTALIKTFDDTAKLQLRKQQKIDGDNCLFYIITTAKTTILLFYRQSKTISHSIEMELHKDQLKLNNIDVWEKLFFGSRISD